MSEVLHDYSFHFDNKVVHFLWIYFIAILLQHYWCNAYLCCEVYCRQYSNKLYFAI